MRLSSPPEISPSNALADYTCVSFVPDIARLTGDANAKTIPEEDYALMCRRVVDVAGCAAGKLQVTLNGINVSFSSFADYTSLYREAQANPIVFEAINPRWTVGVCLSETGSFESVSFVNGMATSRGGTHVNVVVQQLTKRIQEVVEKLEPELGKFVSQALIRRHLFVACDTLIENPTFDSQMKEYLSSSPTTFGSSYTLSPTFLKKVVAPEAEGGPGIVEDILRVAHGRQQAHLMKAVGGKKANNRFVGHPKLDDAHQAGSESGWDCTLILTEGDSAKALAIAGLEVIGRQRFGVFPLRGKFLNVRDAPIEKLTKNAEVKALRSILALDFEKKYETIAERRELRYGRVMLMTDQDQGMLMFALPIFVFCIVNLIFAIDGSHIKLCYNHQSINCRTTLRGTLLSSLRLSRRY
jgi:DNA topoisomerase II